MFSCFAAAQCRGCVVFFLRVLPGIQQTSGRLALAPSLWKHEHRCLRFFLYTSMKIELSLGTDTHVPSLSLPCAVLLGQRAHVRYTAVSYAPVCWSRGTVAFVKASVVTRGGFTAVYLCCPSPVSFCSDAWWVYTYVPLFLFSEIYFYVYFGCSTYMYVLHHMYAMPSETRKKCQVSLKWSCRWLHATM